ncbi:MAG TPA: YciI family protein [Vineibacter sp.]|nr:YciI family protein [Vineibacter sp.]
MRYAILCYNPQAEAAALSPQRRETMMSELRSIQRELKGRGKLGPVAQLTPTTAAVTLKAADSLVVDGPFAETKEQLLGFYIVDCETREEAVEIAHLLEAPRKAAGLLSGALEIRPLASFDAG